LPGANASIDWLSLTCPLCKTGLRIKSAYAHLRGRCPECGGRIEAPRPRAGNPLPRHSYEPGLLPIEEEWPEPAQLEEMETSPAYDVAAATSQWIDKSAEPEDGNGEAYSLAGAPAPPVRRLEDPVIVETYEARAPEGPAERPDSAVPDYLRGIEVEPPKTPSWRDVSSLELLVFPWRRGNGPVWFFLSFDLSLIALLAAILANFPLMGPIVVPVGGLLSLWIGLYAASCFLAVIEETGAGNDRVLYPRGGALIDGWGKLAYVGWLFMCSAIPVGAMWQLGGDALWGSVNLWWIAALAVLTVLFPLVTLSSMASSSHWLIVDRRMMISMAKRPHVIVLLWLLSGALAAGCAWLGYSLMLRTEWSMYWALPVCVGTAWSAALLIYARLLGRAGWRLSQSFARPKIRKARPFVGVAEIDSWGPDPDWDDIPPKAPTEA
jgi:hypothetical protein